MHDAAGDARLASLRAWLEVSLPAYLADLEELVAIDSGSYTKAGVDHVITWMADRLARLGAAIERHPDSRLGDTVVATFSGRPAGATILLIGHADTVFEAGTAAQRPYGVRDGRIRGPGTSDMKAGLLAGLYALEALQAVSGGAGEWLPARRLQYVVNPDEEIGSPVSTLHIERLAADADVALVLEAARENGDIVSARKGMLHLRATLTGRAAHAGVEPERGRSAVLEAAHKTVALHALSGRWPGVTVNVGSVSGGTRPNIVPESALMTIDVRAASATEQREAEAAVRAILEQSTVPDVSCALEITAQHWPMERTAASARLVEEAVRIAARLGFSLRDTATGGGSDANTTAGLGVPSLDGLGPIGGDDHSADEFVVLDSIVPRTALLAELIAVTGGAVPSG